MKSVLMLLLIFSLSLTNRVNSQNVLVFNSPEETRKADATASKLPVFEFRTSLTEQQISEISSEIIEKHELGEMISKKIYLFDSKYTYEMPLVPGNPQSKTMVRKPVIYESVYKIEKHLKKSTKKGDISLENAATIMNKVLDVANCILTVDTNEFEKEIGKHKNPRELTHFFMNQVKLTF